MVFKRRYYNKRRYYKKRSGSYKLNKRNIFGNKSAKSQAKQIYSLNKKINRIQKTTAPEIHRVEGYHLRKTTTDASSHPISQWNTKNSLWKDCLLSGGNPKITINGSLVRVKYIKFYGGMQLLSSTDYITSAGSDRYYDEHAHQEAWLRVIWAWLPKGAGDIPDEIYTGSVDTTGVDIDYRPIFGPLAQNVSTQLRIVKQKILRVSSNRQGVAYKFKLTGKKLMNYRKALNDDALGEGELVMYYQYYCPILNYGYNSFIGPACRIDLQYEIGYVDQN